MSSSHGARIEQYSLQRHYYEVPPPDIDVMWECMGDLVADWWHTYNVMYNGHLANNYTVSILNNAYFTTIANLSNIQEPRMKHRDMIVDNYKRAGGLLSTLERIGFNLITNIQVYCAIQTALLAKGVRLTFPLENPVTVELVRTYPNACRENLSVFPIDT